MHRSTPRLSEQAGIDFVIAPGENNARLGVAVPWRVACYVTGDVEAVKNALLLCAQGKPPQ